MLVSPWGCSVSGKNADPGACLDAVQGVAAVADAAAGDDHQAAVSLAIPPQRTTAKASQAVRGGAYVCPSEVKASPCDADHR